MSMLHVHALETNFLYIELFYYFSFKKFHFCWWWRRKIKKETTKKKFFFFMFTGYLCYCWKHKYIDIWINRNQHQCIDVFDERKHHSHWKCVHKMYKSLLLFPWCVYIINFYHHHILLVPPFIMEYSNSFLSCSSPLLSIVSWYSTLCMTMKTNRKWRQENV